MEHVALDLYANIMEAIYKEIKRAIFLDFAKAFDTVIMIYFWGNCRTVWNKREVVRVVEVIPRKQKTMC